MTLSLSLPFGVAEVGGIFASKGNPLQGGASMHSKQQPFLPPCPCRNTAGQLP
jgi:hypothetical protein